MQAIEEQILQYAKFPWDIMTPEIYSTLKQHITNDISKLNKKDIIRLLNYAFIYNDNLTIKKLVLANVKAANNMVKVNDCLVDEYFSEYTYKNSQQIFNKIKKFGINFRNQFNFTPLMCASYMLNEVHINELIKHNVSLSEVDNRNRNAFMIMLSKIYMNNNIKPDKIMKIYEQLCPSDISIQVDDKLIKIDAHKIEFLLCSLLFLWLQEFDTSDKNKFYTFNSDAILNRFNRLAGTYIMPNFRLKRTYINSILARNEVNSKYPNNRKLFKRISVGKYIINPELKIKINEKWYTINEFTIL